MFECSKFDHIINSYHENKLAHAFLLETNNIEKCYKDLLKLIKMLNCPKNYDDDCKEECNLCNLIDNGNLPSLIEIESEGNFIKKDQILNMMERFSSKPVFSKYNTYIVKNCDRFNSSSANTILKFLEEPTDNIIGFFITTNKMNVISTVRSRCQEYIIFYDDFNSYYDSEDISLFKTYFDNIYKNKDDLLYNKISMSKCFSERIEWQTFFTKMFIYISDVCTKHICSEIEMIKSMDQRNLVKMLNLIETVLKYIKSNGNIELILDKFVIEMRNYYE